MATTYEVLLVEDNPADAHLFKEATKRSGGRINVTWVESGTDALDVLYQRGEYWDAAAIELVILDLNIPGKDGREVLVEMKSDPQIRRIPVVVFTTSEAPDDILGCYDAHANSYVVKPIGLNRLREVIQAVETLFLREARLPSRCNSECETPPLVRTS